MSDRDKRVAAVLPALVTLLLAWLLLLRPLGREVTLLRQRVINQGSVDTKQTQLSLAESAHAELAANVERMRRAPGESPAHFDRNLAMQIVSQLCSAHGLSLIATKLEPSTALPAVLQESLPALTRGAAQPAPQVWRIEVSGSYPAVVKLLTGLQKAQPLIVPLNLSMTADKNERRPATWALTLWL